MAKIKVYYYQWYKIADSGVITVHTVWFPEGETPRGGYWFRDEKSRRRFKEVETNG